MTRPRPQGRSTSAIADARRGLICELATARWTVAAIAADARVRVSEARVRAVLRAEGIAAAPAARGRPASPRPRRLARGVLLAVLTDITTRAGVTPEAALTYLAAQLADPGVTAAIRRTTHACPVVTQGTCK